MAFAGFLWGGALGVLMGLLIGLSRIVERIFDPTIQVLRNVPVKINLIPFNPFSLSNYKRVSNNALRRFQQILMDEGYTTTVRTTRGDDIAAACGQLAGQVNDRTRRSARYAGVPNAVEPSAVDQIVRILPTAN